jgi:hypothetical protein
MAGKARDFTKLKTGLAGLSTGGAQAVPPPEPQTGGQQASDTSPITLRVPAKMMGKLVDDAADRSKAAGRTITRQQLILLILEQHYG